MKIERIALTKRTRQFHSLSDTNMDTPDNTIRVTDRCKAE